MMEVRMSKKLEELRRSSFHQELGRKMCAAFVSQQQGVTLSTALKKVPDDVGDLWLIVADFAERTVNAAIDSQFGSLNVPTTSERVM
jgi:hypothetical protein